VLAALLAVHLRTIEKATQKVGAGHGDNVRTIGSPQRFRCLKPNGAGVDRFLTVCLTTDSKFVNRNKIA
jgi:hypothetical protein